MNNLYKLMLFCGTLASCHTDYGRRHFVQDNVKQSQVLSDIDLRSIDFYSQSALATTSLITSSFYFSAEFDYYQCTVSSQSRPHIEVFFRYGYIYLLSDAYQFRYCHYLNYSDIDDLEVSNERPQFSIGQHKQFSVLRVPIKSAIECLFKMNMIVNFTTDTEESLRFK